MGWRSQMVCLVTELGPCAMLSQPVATPWEIRALYLVSFSGGPVSSVVIIFLQLMIVKQAKYLASQGSDGEDWLEWRDKFSDGPLCNGTGRPHPKNSTQAYERPEGYSDSCIWFPKSPIVPGLGLQYTSTIVYGSTGILLLTGLLLLVIGPFGDYSKYRRQMLGICYVIWVPFFAAIALVSSPEYYWLALLFSLFGSAAYLFGLKSPFAAYLPLLIENSHELADMRTNLDLGLDLEEVSTTFGRGSIELPGRGFPSKGSPNPLYPRNSTEVRFPTNQLTTLDSAKNEYDRKHSLGSLSSLSETRFLVGPSSDIPNHADGVLPPNMVLYHSRSGSAHIPREIYQTAYQSVAAKTALRESASFITGQLLGLFMQFAIVLIYNQVSGGEENPKDTMGERLAIGFAALWGLFFGTIGIMGLKDRPGPPFPPGKKFLIGTLRSLKTLRLLQQKLPNLLLLMLGRMVYWLAIQTILTMSTLFFEREFAMDAEDLLPPMVVYLVVGVPSAIGASFIVQYCSGQTLRVFKIYCLALLLVPFYMLLGVKSRIEVYILMTVAAFLISPFPALVRAMMADMIPQGYTTTIMSLEGLLENSTTWIGPLIVASVMDATGSMRWAVFSMVIFLFIGLPFVFGVDLKAAHSDRVLFEKSSEEIGDVNQNLERDIS